MSEYRIRFMSPQGDWRWEETGRWQPGAAEDWWPPDDDEPLVIEADYGSRVIIPPAVWRAGRIIIDNRETVETQRVMGELNVVLRGKFLTYEEYESRVTALRAKVSEPQALAIINQEKLVFHAWFLTEEKRAERARQMAEVQEDRSKTIGQRIGKAFRKFLGLE